MEHELAVRYLVRFLPSSTTEKRFLGSIRSVAKATGAEARNPKWTSYGGLEIDIFVPSRSDFETFLAAVEPLADLEFQRDLNMAPRHTSEEELFAEARNYFNSERYWECHEVLEGSWRNKSGEEKRLLQGLILVCAALVHHQKREDRVAMGVLRRARAQIAFGSESYFGINLQALSRNVEEIISAGSFRIFKI